MPSEISFRQIDELTREDHHHLAPEDRCYFLREYTSHKGFNYSETNQLISNFKKKPSRRGHSDWKYKGQAIRQIIAELAAVLPAGAFRQDTAIVPIPPSKVEGHPEYDDRMIQVAKGVCIARGTCLDLLRCRQSMDAAHESEVRPSLGELEDNLQVVPSAAPPGLRRIVLLDDVLTAGTHFKAAQRIIQRALSLEVFGVFAARRIFANDHDRELFEALLQQVPDA
jgi:predicted amidophosphoribosyltransferase